MTDIESFQTGLKPPPILLTIFNRPDVTRVAIEPLRKLRPPVLYVSADGPRQNIAGEREACQKTRDLIDTIDWQCQIHRLFAEENRGCAETIQSAITNVLKDHDRLIVLEDDCVADPSFFTFCQTLLNRFEDDERVVAISGNNLQDGVTRGDGSYYFSRYPHCWGWATWRRSWQHYDHQMSQWPSLLSSGLLNQICQSTAEVEYWTTIFNAASNREVDSWAFRWILACWARRGLSVLPQQNLVRNIGFGAGATHTTESAPGHNIPTGSIGKIVHPESQRWNDEADAYTDSIFFSGTVQKSEPRGSLVSTRSLRRRIRRWFPQAA